MLITPDVLEVALILRNLVLKYGILSLPTPTHTPRCVSQDYNSYSVFASTHRMRENARDLLNATTMKVVLLCPHQGSRRLRESMSQIINHCRIP